MYIVECSRQDAQLVFQKSGILFWQRQSLNAGEVTECRTLVVVSWVQIFHQRCIFPHVLSKSQCTGKLSIPRVMADMQKRGQMGHADFVPNTGLALSALSYISIAWNFSLEFLEMF